MAREFSPFLSELLGGPKAPTSSFKKQNDLNLEQPLVGDIRPQDISRPAAKPLRQRITESAQRLRKTKGVATQDKAKVATFTEQEEFLKLADTVGKLPEVTQVQTEIAGLDQLRRSILNAPVQTDLSPLFALVDSETGSNLLAGHRPKDPRSNLKAAAAITSQIVKAQNKLSDLRIAGIKAQKTGTIESLIKEREGLEKLITGKEKVTIGTLARGKTPGALRDKAILKATTNFNKDKGVEKIKRVLRASADARKLVLQGGPVGAEAIKAVFPRLVGEVGNLAKAEQERFGGVRSLKERMSQLFTKLQKGTLTDINKRELTKLVDVLESSAERQLNANAESFSRQAEKGNISLGISKATFLDALSLEPLLKKDPTLAPSRRKVEERLKLKEQKAEGKKLSPAQIKRLKELRKKDNR